jgi:hypothetical protein
MRTVLGMLPFVLVLAVMAPSAAAEVECQNQDGSQIPGCTSVQGPWLQNQPTPEGDPNEYGVRWFMNCLGGRVVLGTDWDAPSSAVDVQTVFIWQLFHQLLRDNTFGLEFVGVNLTERVLTFMPLVGCGALTTAAKARSAAIQAKGRRTITHNLRPNREVTFRHGCGPRQRYLHSTSGVGFFEDQPPSARELREVRVQHRERGGRAIVKVSTGRRAGDDERVALQVHVYCRG